jgi:hypothetical protein
MTIPPNYTTHKDGTDGPETSAYKSQLPEMTKKKEYDMTITAEQA